MFSGYEPIITPMCRAKYLCNQSEADNYAITQIIQGKKGVCLNDSGDPGYCTLNRRKGILSFKMFQSYGDEPSWGWSEFCGRARILCKGFPGNCESHLLYLKIIVTESGYVTWHCAGGWEGNDE